MMENDQNKSKTNDRFLKGLAVLLVILILVTGLTVGGVYLYHQLFNGIPEVIVPSDIVDEVPDTQSDTPQKSPTKPESSAPTEPKTESQTESIADTSSSSAIRRRLPKKAAYLELNNVTAAYNTPFNIDNMLPGDSYSKSYCVRVYHQKPIRIRFSVMVTEETKHFSDILQLKLVSLSDSKVVYDGAFGEAIQSKSIIQEFPESSTGFTDCYYDLTAYLTYMAGNIREDSLLKADISWEVENKENLLPGTGDNFNIYIYILIFLGALLLLVCILLLSRRKKDDRQSGSIPENKREGDFHNGAK